MLPKRSLPIRWTSAASRSISRASLADRNAGGVDCESADGTLTLVVSAPSGATVAIRSAGFWPGSSALGFSEVSDPARSLAADIIADRGGEMVKKLSVSERSASSRDEPGSSLSVLDFDLSTMQVNKHYS